MLHRIARGVLAGVRRGSEARGPYTQYGTSVTLSHSPGRQARGLLSTAETAASAVVVPKFRWMGRGLVGLGLGSGAAATALALTTPQPDGVDLDLAHVDLRPPTLGELVPRSAVLSLLFCPLLVLAPFAVASDRLRDVFFRLLTYTLALAGPAFIKWGQVRDTGARGAPTLNPCLFAAAKAWAGVSPRPDALPPLFPARRCSHVCVQLTLYSLPPLTLSSVGGHQTGPVPPRPMPGACYAAPAGALSRLEPHPEGGAGRVSGTAAG
jgi:hypothetical protein